MLCKVLIASTYNYIRNTCLRLVLRLGCSSLFFGQSWCNSVNCTTVICSPSTLFFCLRGTTSETLNPGPSFTFIAFVVTFTFFAAPTTLLLLCGVGDWGSLKGYTRQHTVATYILSSAFSGVVELTTQLLRLISILWLPLCRINKLGYSYPRRLLRSPTLVGYQDYFLAPLPGSIALLISSLDKYTFAYYSVCH